MAELIIGLIALVLIVLGARGSYQSVWNTIFPNFPLQIGGPSSVIPATGNSGGGAGGQFGTPSTSSSGGKTTIAHPGSTTTNPNSGQHVIIGGQVYPVTSVGVEPNNSGLAPGQSPVRPGPNGSVIVIGGSVYPVQFGG